MTKLIMWNLISLDGFFEGGKNWDLDFHQSVWGDELESLTRTVKLRGRSSFRPHHLRRHGCVLANRDRRNRRLHEPPAESRRLTNTRTRQLDQHKIDRGQRRRRNTTTQATGQWKHIRLRQRQPLRNFAGARSV